MICMQLKVKRPQILVKRNMASMKIFCRKKAWFSSRINIQFARNVDAKWLQKEDIPFLLQIKVCADYNLKPREFRNPVMKIELFT